MRKASDLFAHFWSGPAPEHDRFTLEELKRLHAVLCDNALITDNNRDLVVETLRSLAELMIWGDQHEPKFFDFFAEKHLLGHFNRILLQPENRHGEIPRQVCISDSWVGHSHPLRMYHSSDIRIRRQG